MHNQAKFRNRHKTKDEINIKDSIIAAKAGFKKSFEKLWDFYYPITIRNADRFCKIYRGFEQYRKNILYESYRFFWEAILEYDDDIYYPFGYYYSEFLIKKTKKLIEVKGYLPPELIKEEEIRNDPGFISKIDKEKLEDITILIKTLTPKQLEAVYLYYYAGIDRDSAASVANISTFVFGERIQYALRKMKKMYKRMLYSKMTKKQKTEYINLGRNKR